MQHLINRRSIRGRGIAYVMVMLYLMLFSVLAIGFCAASNMSVQIAKNDRAVAESLAAADSGMQFARLQLGKISVPANISDIDLPGVLAEQLGRQLDGTPNMAGQAVRRMGHVVFVPGASSYIPLDATTGTRFRIQLAVVGKATCGSKRSAGATTPRFCGRFKFVFDLRREGMTMSLLMRISRRSTPLMKSCRLDTNWRAISRRVRTADHLPQHSSNGPQCGPRKTRNAFYVARAARPWPRYAAALSALCSFKFTCPDPMFKKMKWPEYRPWWRLTQPTRGPPVPQRAALA